MRRHILHSRVEVPAMAKLVLEGVRVCSSANGYNGPLEEVGFGSREWPGGGIEALGIRRPSCKPTG